jgi:hypothetical protein
MIRGLLLPLLVSTAVLGPLMAAAGAGDLPAASLPDAGSSKDRSPADPAAPAKSNGRASAREPAKIDDGRMEVTRSDGSTVRTKLPDQKVIRKLVGSMRDGMARADRAEKQGQTKRGIQYRPARSKK